MEEIKQYLKHDYDVAVDAFNKRDYRGFFRNIRPAIELLCKLLIHEFVSDEDLAEDIVSGNVSIKKDRTSERYIVENDFRRIQGSALAAILPGVYFYKHSDVAFSRVDQQKKRLKKGIETNAANLYQWYSTASELGSHTGASSMNDKKQALACATFFPGFFDFMKSNHVLQPSTISFFDSFDDFNFSDGKGELEEAKKQINDANAVIEEQKAAILAARKLQLEAENEQMQLEQKTAEMESRMIEQQKEIEKLKKELEKMVPIDIHEADEEPIVVNQPRGNLLSALRVNSDWDLDEESMDDDQLDLIERTLDKPMLVAGCAGSGKSVIAMHKAEQIAQLGEDVVLIAYTKSLTGFMNVGKPIGPYRFYYHNQWVKQGKPQADYIIVDEIQDFTQEEIQDFIQAAKKYYMFFGDTAQSIYKQYGKQTLTIEEIAKLTGLNVLKLYNNYRLPRSVAKITQDYVGVNVDPYKEKVYQNKEKSLPYIIYKNSIEEQVDSIKAIVGNNAGKSIGILLPYNELALNVSEELRKKNVGCELKYSTDMKIDTRYVDTLDFATIMPKIMTYHSAKGLQFDIVILPMYNGASDNESRKALYVAMTRTMHKLYVFYSTPKLAYPLSDVPSRLYLKNEA
jgi:hypothetical protein